MQETEHYQLLLRNKNTFSQLTIMEIWIPMMMIKMILIRNSILNQMEEIGHSYTLDTIIKKEKHLDMLYITQMKIVPNIMI